LNGPEDDIRENPVADRVADREALAGAQLGTYDNNVFLFYTIQVAVPAKDSRKKSIRTASVAGRSVQMKN